MKRRRTNEDLAALASSAEADHELQMARSQLYKIAQYAIKLHEMMKEIDDPKGIEAWQSAKITKASDYMSAVYHNLDYKLKFNQGGELGAEPGEIAVGEGTKKKKYGKMKETDDPYVSGLRKQLAEKAKSEAQQKAAGMALAAKRGEMPKSELQGAAKEMMSMSKSDLEDIASTKHKGLPKHVDEAPYRGRSNRYGGSMGGPDKRDFKRREMEKELGDEDAEIRRREAEKRAKESGDWYVMIDGKIWKKGGEAVKFDGKKHANNVGLKLMQKYPGKDIKITSNPAAAAPKP